MIKYLSKTETVKIGHIVYVVLEMFLNRVKLFEGWTPMLGPTVRLAWERGREKVEKKVGEKGRRKR